MPSRSREILITTVGQPCSSQATPWRHVHRHLILGAASHCNSIGAFTVDRAAPRGGLKGQGSQQIANCGAISSSTMSTEACCTPAPAATVEYVGKEETLAGTKVYTTGSPTASAAVILVSDLFGFETPLLRKLADKVAAAGYLVVVPDVLQGDPFAGSFARGELDLWLAKHPATGAALEVGRSIVEAVKDKGIAAVGAAGFCYGSKVVGCLGKDKNLRAVVQLHPSLMEASDYEKVAVPIAVLAAPTDGIEKYEELLASRTDVKSFVKVFPGVEHGWTVRYDETDEAAVEKANEAHKLMLDWFAKYL